MGSNRGPSYNPRNPRIMGSKVMWEQILKIWCEISSSGTKILGNITIQQ